jgi:hypothetical protein
VWQAALVGLPGQEMERLPEPEEAVLGDAVLQAAQRGADLLRVQIVASVVGIPRNRGGLRF